MRMTSWTRLPKSGALLLLCAIGLSACSSEATSGGADGEDSTGSAGSSTYGETPCAQCIRGVCATELAACDADAECKAYLDCIFACPPKNDHEVDGDCSDLCAEPESSAPLEAFGSCFKQQLEDSASQCSASCGE